MTDFVILMSFKTISSINYSLKEAYTVNSEESFRPFLRIRFLPQDDTSERVILTSSRLFQQLLTDAFYRVILIKSSPPHPLTKS